VDVPTPDPVDAPRARLSGEDRRAAIIAAARPVFGERGFHGSSTAEIAAAACCSEPTLYKHFESKQVLFAAVLADASAEMKVRVTTALDGAEDRFAAFIATMREVLPEPGFAELVRLRSLAMAMIDDPAVLEPLRKGVDGQRGTVAGAVRDGQARGTVRADVDPEAIGWLAVGLSLVASFRNAIDGPAGLAGMDDVLSALEHLLTTKDPVR
jgi:AcrR family transcriptional regulator